MDNYYSMNPHTQEEPGHYQHKCKCMNCSLHFVVCSWSATWGEKTIHCPECGQTNVMKWKGVPQKEPIFTVVPGNAVF
jgi:transcription elongation factor Elf1